MERKSEKTKSRMDAGGIEKQDSERGADVMFKFLKRSYNSSPRRLCFIARFFSFNIYTFYFRGSTMTKTNTPETGNENKADISSVRAA